jgi:ATP-binding cassette subfamily B protein
LLQPVPRLVLLDEPFRGLDRTQRQALLREARAWWQHSTLLCVTHDVLHTQDFARVLVVDDGRVVEDGTPAQLLARPSRYRDLIQAETQLHQQAWGGPQWRRLQLQHGVLTELTVPTSASHPGPGTATGATTGTAPNATTELQHCAHGASQAPQP